MTCNLVDVCLVVVDGQKTVSILSLVVGGAGTNFRSEGSRGIDQVVLECFHQAVGQIPTLLVTVLDTILSEEVSKTDNTNTEGTACLGCCFSTGNGITLVIDQSIQTTDSDITEILQFFQAVDLADVDSRQDAQGDLTVGIIDVVERFGGEGDLLTQVAHVDGNVETAVGVAVVNVHDVDATGLGTLFHQGKEQVTSGDGLAGDQSVGLILLVESIELRLSEGIIQTGNITRGEQGDVLVADEAGVEQLGDLDGVIQFANTVVFGTLVVLENDDVFDLFMPDGEVNGSRTTTDSILGTAANGCFELLQERDDSSVRHFATTNLVTESTDATGVDTNTSTLRGIVTNSHVRREDAIEGVVCLNKDATRILTNRSTHACHNGRRNIDKVTRHSVVVTLNKTQANVWSITVENRGSDEHVHELGSLEDLPSGAVLTEILVIDLTETCVGELEVAVVVDVGIEFSQFLIGIIIKDSRVVDATLDAVVNLLAQSRSFPAATIDGLTQGEQQQTCCNILIVGILQGDQVRR